MTTMIMIDIMIVMKMMPGGWLGCGPGGACGKDSAQRRTGLEGGQAC